MSPGCSDRSGQLGLLGLQEIQGAGNVPDSERQVRGPVSRLHQIARRLAPRTGDGYRVCVRQESFLAQERLGFAGTQPESPSGRLAATKIVP